MSGDPAFLSYNGVLPWVERVRIVSGMGFVGTAAASPTAALQVFGSFTVSITDQDPLAAASIAIDSHVSVSSIVHITSSPFSPIGAGGNTIRSDTAAVSMSSSGSITLFTGGN